MKAQNEAEMKKLLNGTLHLENCEKSGQPKHLVFISSDGSKYFVVKNHHWDRLHEIHKWAFIQVSGFCYFQAHPMKGLSRPMLYIKNYAIYNEALLNDDEAVCQIFEKVRN